ncbi:hypothetical protein ACFX15_039553 [Malus domestica]
MELERNRGFRVWNRNTQTNKDKKNVSFDCWKIDNSACVFSSSDVNSKNKNFSSAMPFDSVQFHGPSLPFLKAVAARIELSSTVPHCHCVPLPYLQAPRPGHLIRRYCSAALALAFTTTFWENPA